MNPLESDNGKALKTADTQENVIFGIDLGTTYSCISYIDEHDKATVIPNKEHNLTTPSVVLFEDEKRLVGDEAKNSAILNTDNVVEMVKRHMGEPGWYFSYQSKDYTSEEITSYIIRKLALDTQESLGIPVKNVVITCPAYFGIAQREATARAGEIAGLNVREVINEPTAAAIAYGIQHEQDQVILVYDLGGGTFDITVMEIKEGVITAIATGGDHNLGGRNWDEKIVRYLAQQWQGETCMVDDPIASPNTLQDLWLKAEKAKQALTLRNETNVVVTHKGQTIKVTLSRVKFNVLTANLLSRTIQLTKDTIEEARKRGYTQFDKLLLVGGSTKMPQIAKRLEKEFHLPQKLFEPDEAVAKGAALYGRKLLLDQRIRLKLSEMTNMSIEEVDAARLTPTIIARAQVDAAHDLGLHIETAKKLANTTITNVASHSFGIVVIADHNTSRSREVISNLVLTNDSLPVSVLRLYETVEADQESVEFQIMENTEQTAFVEQDKYTEEAEIGQAVLPLPPELPDKTPIEITFELDQQGRLRVIGREPHSGAITEAIFEAKGGISDVELEEAKSRATSSVIL